MAKSVKKQAAATSARSSRKPRRSQKPPRAINPTQTRSGTKQSAAIEMLRSPSGTSIDALMKATGWQRHSVRGFLAGVVRKRLKLELASTLVEGRRVYRINGGPEEEPAEAHARHRNS